MEVHERVEQWEKMSREAPDDMAWFSLGNAYRDAGRPEDAQRAFAKALECNPGLSRAYQLRAQSLIQLGRHDEAAQVLTQGYTTAAQRGDTMPQRAMASLLEKLGRPVPAVAAAQAATSGAGSIVCRKTGRPGTRMSEPPMRGPVGRFIADHYCQETWRAWIRMGTKVINELRLDFSNPQQAQVYDMHMMEWLGFTEDEVREEAQGRGAPGT